MQKTYQPESIDSALRKYFPNLHLINDTEEEFDPNELKLLPVLATHRNARRNNELRSQ